MTRRPWSGVEVALLHEHYATSDTADLAAALGRTPFQVMSKANSLGLHKTHEFLSAAHGPRASVVGKETRFQPGLVPWNKGSHYVAGGRSPETRFRRGHRPRTWVAVGSYRVNGDGYLDRKVSDTGYPPRDWQAVHRIVWRECHGPIPEGHVVVFRPGRRTSVLAEITVDALELVSRAELLRRNSVHRHGPEIAQLSQLKGAIKRQINRRMEKESA